MVVIKEFDNKVDQLSLHRNLTVITKEQVETQIIYIDLINDFDLKKIRILINGYGPFPEWMLILIILGSIIGGLFLMAAVFVVVKRVRDNGGGYSGQDEGEGSKESIRESLVTDGRGRDSLAEANN